MRELLEEVKALQPRVAEQIVEPNLWLWDQARLADSISEITSRALAHGFSTLTMNVSASLRSTKSSTVSSGDCSVNTP